MTTLLFHLLYAAIALAVLYVFVALILRAFRPCAAVVHRVAWLGVLVVPMLVMCLPVRVEVRGQRTEDRGQKTGGAEVSRQVAGNTEWVPFDANNEIAASQKTVQMAPAVQARPPLRLDTAMLVPLLLAVWSCGVVVLAVRSVKRRLKLRRYLMEQVRLGLVIPEHAAELWRRVTLAHGVSPLTIPLLATESLGPALVRSGVRLYLLVPQTVCEELPEELLEGVFRHELGHHLHRDAILTPLARILAAVMWFHPLARRALVRYETAAEWACDEFAYLRSDRTGSTLLAETFLSIHQGTESLALNLNTFSRFNTLERVDRLIRAETQEKETLMKKTLLFALLGLLFLVGTLRIELVARENPESPEQKPVATEDDTAYHGTVVDEDGNPAPGVKVQAVQSGEETFTNEKGEFSFPNPMKWEEFIATDHDRGLIGMDGRRRGNEAEPFKLHKARRITGTVVDTDGKPAVGATVVGNFQTVISEIVRTNDKGEFEFLYPDNEQISMQVVCAYEKGKGLDFVPTKEYPFFSNYGATPKNLISNGPFHLKLRPVEPVKIRVVDEAGEPIPGVNVQTWIIANPKKPDDFKPLNDQRNLFNTSGMKDFSADTDAEGYATMDTIPKDFLEDTSFTVGPSYAETLPRFSDIYTTWEKMTRNGQSPTVVLPPAAIVQGSVKLADGTPVPNAEIFLRYHNGGCASPLANDHGEFVLVQKPHTLLNISVRSKLGVTPSVFGFDVGDGSEVKRLDFVLKKGIRLHGKVYDQGDSLAKDFYVQVKEIDPNPPASYDPQALIGVKPDGVTYYYNTADLEDFAGTEESHGEYECVIPAVRRDYGVSAETVPNKAMITKSHLLKVNGDEKEIEYDFHLDADRRIPFRPSREVKSE